MPISISSARSRRITALAIDTRPIAIAPIAETAIASGPIAVGPISRAPIALAPVRCAPVRCAPIVWLRIFLERATWYLLSVDGTLEPRSSTTLVAVPSGGARREVDESANWVWLSVIPFGLGAWAPIYAGARVHNRRWMTIGAVWSLIAVLGWVVAIASNGGGAGGLLIILGWAGAAATSFAIRDRYRQMLGSPFETAVTGAEGRLAERDRARKLARERPALALEMGIGRPDLPNAQSAGLVDVNNAPARHHRPVTGPRRRARPADRPRARRYPRVRLRRGSRYRSRPRRQPRRGPPGLRRVPAALRLS